MEIFAVLALLPYPHTSHYFITITLTLTLTLSIQQAYLDALNRLIYVNSYASLEANKNMSEPALLRLSKQSMDFCFSPPQQAIFRQAYLSKAEEFRAGGIIYGQYSALLKKTALETSKNGVVPPKVQTEIELSEKKMYYLWNRCVELDPVDNSVRQFVEHRINPYLQGKMQPNVVKEIEENNGMISDPFEPSSSSTTTAKATTSKA